MSVRQSLQANDKGKRSVDKKQKNKKFKKYWNKITVLLKTSRQAHYHKYFEENKKNCRALWIAIKEIVYSKNRNKRNSPS